MAGDATRYVSRLEDRRLISNIWPDHEPELNASDTEFIDNTEVEDMGSQRSYHKELESGENDLEKMNEWFQER